MNISNGHKSLMARVVRRGMLECLGEECPMHEVVGFESLRNVYFCLGKSHDRRPSAMHV